MMQLLSPSLARKNYAMKTMHLLASTSIAVLAASTAPAMAQANPNEIVVNAQRVNATEIMNTGSAGVLGDKAAEDLPFNLRSFDETLILNQQPQTLGEVLENDPTIRMSYGFGNASELFVIRGFPLFGDDVGLNGLYGIAPRQLIAPELFESVQVLNGASAFLNGAAPGGSSVGGSVNLVLKRAKRDPLMRATLGYTSNSHFGGSFDVSRRFGAADEFGLRVNGAYRDGEVGIDREDRRTQVVGAGFDYTTDNFRAKLDLAYQEVRVDALRPKVTVGTLVIPKAPKSDANYAQNFTYTKMRDIFGSLSLEYDLDEHAMLYAKAGARDGLEDGIYGGITVLDAVTGAANGNALYVPRTDNNEAIEAGLRVTLGSAVTHEINFGGNVNWQTNRNAYDFLYGPGFAGFATNLYNTPQVPIPASTLVGGDLDDPFAQQRNRLWSAFASDTIGFWDDRILITGGLRLQHIKVTTYTITDGSVQSRYNKSALTPVAGIVVKPVEGLSLYANRIEALQQGPTAPQNPILTNPDEVFSPFKSVQYEVGGKARLGTMFAGLALYQIELPNFGAVLVNPANPAGLQTFRKNGEQTNRGIELTLNGEIVPGLRLISGLAISDAKLDAGTTVKGVPDWTANADLEWDLPFVPGLTLTGRVMHTGKQYVDIANALRLPDWTVFDMGARYVLAAGETPVTLRLTVDNVTDKRYWSSAYDSFAQALLQGQPRTFKASISADF